MNVYAMAACYSPDDENPGKAILPFEIATGRLIDEVWAKWLEWDPVRMAPHHGDALSSMKRIYLDAGKKDQFFLDLGAQAFAEELDKLGVDYTLELFEGTHMGLQYRYPGALRALAEALSDRG
jgi:S-formylglutathione hydrolase FrmB